MTLFSFGDFYNQPQDQMKNCQAARVTSFTLWTDAQQQIGFIRELLVDEMGYFRYLVVQAEMVESSKMVLLPIGLAQFDWSQQKAVVSRLQPPVLQQLPSYLPHQEVDGWYEQRVRDALLPIASRRMGRQFLQQPYTDNGQYRGTSSGYTPSATRNYNHFPTFYGMSDRDNQRPLKQLENQLI